MTPEHIAKVFNKIFNTPGRTIGVTTDTTEEKDDTVVIDGCLYIRKAACIEIKSIRGSWLADGYIVEKSVTKSNYPDGPDDVDCVEICDPVRSLSEAVVVAITAYAKMLAEHELEIIAISEALANNEF